MDTLKIGIIGYGVRARAVFVLIYGINKGKKVELTAVCDPADEQGLRDRFAADNIDLTNTKFYADDVDKMLEENQFDGIIIGTRCNLHSELAAKVLKKRIPLFLEKPVSTTMEEWELLKKAYDENKTEVVVSFPLRLTELVKEVKTAIKAHEIGPIQHVAAFNYVTYGGDYYHNWYKDESITGGLFLQKSTHDFDYINYIVEQKPVQICAMNSKQIMKGNKPAGLKCEDCPEQYTCKEGPHMTRAMGDYVHGPYCCYSEDVGNEDSGTAIVRYESGMHMVYTQNFFVRNKHAAKRGAIFSGEGGTVEFDWATSEIKVRKNYTPHDCVYKIETVGNHGGGDMKLADNFYDVMMGTDVSHTPLEEGLSSAYLCLKAKESAETGKFADIEYRG